MIALWMAISVFVLQPSCVQPLGGAKDAPFDQEYHEAHPLGGPDGADDVRAVAVDGQGSVWAATRAGVYRLAKGDTRWTMPGATAGPGGDTRPATDNPTYDLAADRRGTVWVGAWDGLYRSSPGGLEKITGVEGPITALCFSQDVLVAAGPEGLWHLNNATLERRPLPCARSVRRLAADGRGGIWIATGMGLVHHSPVVTRLYQSEKDILSSDVRAVAVGPDGAVWSGGLGGVTVFRGGRRVDVITPRHGLPGIDVQAVARGPDGRWWVGTAGGLARFDGRGVSVRHSRRWLLSDDVRHVAFDSEGTAWIATAGGVSAIRRTPMTLAQKAERLLEACLARHVREPGLVEKCRLRVPGDVSTWEPRDDDNDGQYTAMYLAMESFRFAVTKDPRARANARRAFEALRFLQTVTETPGFVARTVIPADWTRMADPNERISDAEWAERRARDPRDKRVPDRWRLSRDGRWRWKGDTSSDEITGHMFGYLFYYDLAADEPQRERVRTHVRRIVDTIVDNGYVLKDLDGAHTCWGVWAPQRLNHDPDWAPERGVNSVEILSFLQLAHHVSGDARYRRLALSLLHEHGYAANVRRAKTFAPAWRTLAA